MNVQRAVELFAAHQRSTVKKRTQVCYKKFLEAVQGHFSDRQIDSITSEELCSFLETHTQHLAKSTRRLRYAQLKAFFNFIIESQRLNIQNPCNFQPLFKSFKAVERKPRKILDKETVDELIFNAPSPRDRLILELQARCGLRIGEVLKLKVSDVVGRKLQINEPKSGRDVEMAFMPEHIASRLADYIATRKLAPEDRVFQVGYTTVRTLIRTIGRKLNVRIAPHDLRRHSATYASRNGVPLEIVSKVILRHQDLKTTQIYLGKVSDTEAIRWMDVLHSK